MFKFDLHWITDGILRQTKNTSLGSGSKQKSFLDLGWWTTILVLYDVFQGNEESWNLSINSQRLTYDELHHVFRLLH